MFHSENSRYSSSKNNKCSPFIGKVGRRGEDGSSLTHTAYRNSNYHIIYAIPFTQNNIETGNLPGQFQPLPLEQTFGDSIGNNVILKPGTHRLRFNANTTWQDTGSDILIFRNVYLQTFVKLGNRVIKSFRQNIPEFILDFPMQNEEHFLPSISFDFCVCLDQEESLTIYMVMIDNYGSQTQFIQLFININDMLLSIDSAENQPKEYDDVTKLLKGPQGYSGEPFNTTVFRMPLLDYQLESYGLIYDVDDPLANPLLFEKTYGKCVRYKEESDIGYFEIMSSGYYRFHFSSTLNVDFIIEEDTFVSSQLDLMQINLIARINDNDPFIVKGLTTSIDRFYGAHKILDGFFEQPFNYGDKISLYIQYFLTLDNPLDESWQVLLGILSAKVPNIQVNNKILRSKSQPIVIIEKIK